MDAGSETTTNYGFDPIVASVDGLPAPVVDVLANLHFGAVTFTTPGYGDVQPATPVGELLATVESFLGALLVALLVFVLGRRGSTTETTPVGPYLPNKLTEISTLRA